MKKYFLITVFNFIFLSVNGSAPIRNPQSEIGNTKTDSLLTLLKTDKPDTNKVKHLNELGLELMYQNPDTAIILGKQALSIITPSPSVEFPAKKGLENNMNKGLLANTLGNLGRYYCLKSDYSKGFEYFQKALRIEEELKNKKGIADQLGSIGIAYQGQGDYPKALDNYLRALQLTEELGDKIGIARHLGNIGHVYSEIGDYPKEMDYYLRALKMYEELGDKRGIARLTLSMGNAYMHQGNYPKTMDCYIKALKIYEDLRDKNGVAISLGNIGALYYFQKDYPKALDYFFRALEMNKEIGYKRGISYQLKNIGSLYAILGKFKEAEQYLKKSIAISDSIGDLQSLIKAEGNLAQLYDTMGRFQEALLHYKKSIALKDTLFSQENKKELIRKEMNYEFDKKEAVTKAEYDKEIAVAEVKKKKQQFILILVFCILILVFLFAGFIFRSLGIARKQKNIIELQKNEMYQQKEIVEKQKEKIIDSITYAQRIQQSILMEESEIQFFLPESFIYYQPKDIVSGDFYWCSKIDDTIIIAAVDCTGHGVPGAFMSIIGNTLMNQIVNEKHVTKPSEILRLLNLGVYEALHQKKEGALSDDGMDVTLCTIDFKNNEVQYAGQNPLYVLSDGRIEVIKGNIHGIGGGGMIAKLFDPLKKEFTNHVIPIQKDMSIFLFSDGYVDQFGGSNRKKFGSHKFKELLLNSQHLGMQKQKELIALAHTEWKGGIAQIDDVLVIGIKLQLPLL